MILFSKYFFDDLSKVVIQTYLIEVEVRDLYQIGFNPVLSLEDMEGQRRGTVNEEVRKEQEYIA